MSNPFSDLIAQASSDNGVDNAVLANLVQAESSGNPLAVSNRGAIGLTQLMPGTAKLEGVTDPTDPEQNLEGGAGYLSEMLGKFGNYTQALEAYNAGPSAVASGNVPQSSVDYAAKILSGTPFAQTTTQPPSAMQNAMQTIPPLSDPMSTSEGGIDSTITNSITSAVSGLLTGTGARLATIAVGVLFAGGGLLFLIVPRVAAVANSKAVKTAGKVAAFIA